MRVLELDIETAPNIAYVWGLFKENIPLARLKDSGYVLSWSAKWFGSETIMFSSRMEGERNMLKRIHKLLSEADVVVHYYGKKFDIPTLNKEFIKNKMMPPSTYKQIDLHTVVKQQFRFPSNKLDYVVQALGLGAKVRHPGFEMWIDCMNDDPVAWEKMKEYNIGDVVLLEELYIVLLPWIKNHPNVGIYDNIEHACPNCGSPFLERRGFSYTAVGRYQRYQCKDCGTWSRGKKSDAVKNVLVQDKS